MSPFLAFSLEAYEQHRQRRGGADVPSASSRTFEDIKVGVRCKLAALWIAMLFLVFVSLVLRPAVNRWANIVLPSLYVVSIVASAIGEILGLLLVLEHHREWPADADRLVRMDMAQAGRDPLTTQVTTRCS
jgi:hypothetical protein